VPVEVEAPWPPGAGISGQTATWTWFHLAA
jgi:hypothetical protein